jgi:hypothetical protein
MTNIDVAVREHQFGHYVLDRCRMDGECWMWTLGSNNTGYAIFNTGRFGEGLVHRHLFSLVYPNRLRNKWRLRNTCNRRLCVNPAHWKAMSPSEFLRDQYRSGARAGERLYRSALKGHTKRAKAIGSFERAAEARQLRNDGLTVSQIAERMNISRATASRWSGGRSWRQVTPFSGLLT